LQLELSTPALLFPAISLLLLAYTNRFLHLAALIRKLHSDFLAGHDRAATRAQIDNLRARLRLIRWMQGLGVASLLGCTLAISALFFRWPATGACLRGRRRLFRCLLGGGGAFFWGCRGAISPIFCGGPPTGACLFSASVILMAASLTLSLREIMISGGALAILLRELEKEPSDAERSR
jgi:hypothetical protein